ncbi:MAG: mannose-1-phosphate guanylyltransferase, partial [Candidatus Dormibacteraeota bacterium]|nr:mannose-1-phosphate guanylyltransferase [Candidatus Dormibacteraeota bacterium]
AQTANAQALPAFRAGSFREKPPKDMAEAFVSGGRHLWNLGLFAWPASLFLDELERADPAVRDGVERTAEAVGRGDGAAAASAYAAIPVQPVEPLLLERGAPLVVVEASFAWSDVGSWQDLYEAKLAEGAGDDQGNVVDGDAVLLDATGNEVLSRSGRTVALVDVADLVVVDTPDALLVVPRAGSQRVREVVERLRER